MPCCGRSCYPGGHPRTSAAAQTAPEVLSSSSWKRSSNREQMFSVATGNHCLLRYMAGYVAKASDAMQFSKHQSLGEGHWRQAYRLLCKKSPTEQEMLMEFSGLRHGETHILWGRYLRADPRQQGQQQLHTAISCISASSTPSR